MKNQTLGQSDHVKRLDIGLEDRSMCWQKASCREFRHRAEGSDIVPRRSEVMRVNMPIRQHAEGEDDTPKDRTSAG